MFSNSGILGLGRATPPAERVSTVMTSWGYIIRNRDHDVSRAALIERICLLAGAALVIPGAWHWAFNSAGSNLSRMDQHILLAVSVIIAGLLFLWISNRGLREELHIDRANKQVRVMSVNRLGQTKMKSRYDFDAIESVFAKKSDEGEIELCRRLAGLEEIFANCANTPLAPKLAQRGFHVVGDTPTLGEWKQVKRG
ncbi:hypothetical protein [Actibacterium pelagium]|uniref:Uncharacterized protein n=1 Tax=Actibacterium pelagium TaxID=2029103 RepID=A0A917AC20_9RHOB|nr:hypothetical protein [Actibacterium pelagium]GGE40429.1 hypothetical protein GCM10011517_05140 [Actibacterium pelagium]